MNSKNLENDFSAFEQELDKPITASAPAEEPDFSMPEPDFEKPVSPPETPPPPQPELKPVPEVELSIEEPPAPEPIVNEERPRTEHPPLTTDDMTKLATQLEQTITESQSLRDHTRQMAVGILSSANSQQDPTSRVRLPKGLRTTLAYLNGLTSVLIATKAIVDTFLELGVEPLYQSVDDSGLKTAAKSTISTFRSHVPTMQEGLDDIERSMADGYDRPSANLRMRIVKAQAQMTQTLAYQQAQALVQTIEAFPLENGALRLLCLIQEKGDSVVMDSIDRTMDTAGHLQTPVADAPAMLDAVLRDDQKTVNAIIAKKFNNF